MPSSPKVPVQSVPVLEPGGSGRMSFEWHRALTELTRAVRELQAGGGGGGITTEEAVDAVAAAFAAGTHSNITVSYNDAGNSLSLAASAGYTDEQAVDAVATAIANGTHTGISIAYNDAANSISFTNTGGGGGGTIPEAVSLYAAMVSWWNFEENDGTALYLDAVGPNDLSVRQGGSASTTAATSDASGLLSRAFYPNAASVSQRSAYIPTASAFKFPNANFSFGLWCKTLTTASGSGRILMGNIGGTATDFQAYLSIEGGDDKLHFTTSTSGNFTTFSRASSTYAPSSSAWMLIVGTLNRSSNQIELRIRKVGDASMTKVTTAFAGALYTGATNANFAINDGLSSNSSFLSGSRSGVNYADSAFYMTAAITDAEFDYLFNAGAGRTWANIVTDSGN